VSGKLLNAFVLRGDDNLRVGFVSRRDIGGAVARNRARRVLREAWRQVAPEASLPADLVFVGRVAILGAGTAEVAHEMRALLARTGLIGE
jgi:ribonuclease P protein component